MTQANGTPAAIAWMIIDLGLPRPDGGLRFVRDARQAGALAGLQVMDPGQLLGSQLAAEAGVDLGVAGEQGGDRLAGPGLAQRPEQLGEACSLACISKVGEPSDLSAKAVG